MSEDKKGGINWGWVIFIIIVIALAYNQDTAKTIETDYGYQVETSGVTKKPNCDSIAPSNPYDEGTGHYAGYEWGEQGHECGGDSDSFIEGCQEYVNQENAYNYCLDRGEK